MQMFKKILASRGFEWLLALSCCAVFWLVVWAAAKGSELNDPNSLKCEAWFQKHQALYVEQPPLRYMKPVPHIVL